MFVVLVVRMSRIFVVLERQVFIFEETRVFQVLCVDICKYYKSQLQKVFANMRCTISISQLSLNVFVICFISSSGLCLQQCLKASFFGLGSIASICV